jgi:hypothetical protein
MDRMSRQKFEEVKATPRGLKHQDFEPMIPEPLIRQMNCFQYA